MIDHLAKIGQKDPEWSVAEWVQGAPVSLAQLRGRVVLIEVFQVNCPGCFLYSLPKAIELHHRYENQGLAVIGIATAFEDFEKNTLGNLQALVATGAVVGETQHMLSAYGFLVNGRWPMALPFSVAMDQLVELTTHITPDSIRAFINENLPDFHQQTAAYRMQIEERVTQHLQNLRYRAQTFERYRLQGTPSQLLIDRQGVLRFSRFGDYPELDQDVQLLMDEPPA